MLHGVMIMYVHVALALSRITSQPNDSSKLSATFS